MRRMVLLGFVFLAGCTQLKVVEVDPDSGYFPGALGRAAIVKKERFDLDSRKELVLVPNDEFVEGMVLKIDYFDEVMTFDDLERGIVAEGLGDKVPTVDTKIGVNNAAKRYRNFMWLRFAKRREGYYSYTQLILTDPLTLEDYFIAETHLDYGGTGVNDQHNWYPMFNALIDYVKANSATYGKSDAN